MGGARVILVAALASAPWVMALRVENKAQNNTTTTQAPSRLSESERLAAIIVPSVVGGLILIGIAAFAIIKVKEKRQTEGTYRPSNEEQAGSRVEPNAALKLPPEERLI